MKGLIGFVCMGLVLFSAALTGQCFATSESLKLEGITEGMGGESSGLAAIINGEIVGKGDRAGGMVVLDVEAKGVHLEDTETGEKIFLTLGGTTGTEEPAAERA